jgi:hypothetical protein
MMEGNNKLFLDYYNNGLEDEKLIQKVMKIYFEYKSYKERLENKNLRLREELHKEKSKLIK